LEPQAEFVICFKCSAWAHAGKLPFEARQSICGPCSGRHSTLECRDQHRPKCPNCSGPHKAWELDCRHPASVQGHKEVTAARKSGPSWAQPRNSPAQRASVGHRAPRTDSVRNSKKRKANPVGQGPIRHAPVTVEEHGEQTAQPHEAKRKRTGSADSLDSEGQKGPRAVSSDPGEAPNIAAAPNEHNESSRTGHALRRSARLCSSTPAGREADTTPSGSLRRAIPAQTLRDGTGLRRRGAPKMGRSDDPGKACKGKFDLPIRYDGQVCWKRLSAHSITHISSAEKAEQSQTISHSGEVVCKATDAAEDRRAE
jgi:hypothetical protein